MAYFILNLDSKDKSYHSRNLTKINWKNTVKNYMDEWSKGIDTCFAKIFLETTRLNSNP